MRYLVRAKLRPDRAADLLVAIDDGTLGQGSVAGGEYIRNMHEARLLADGTLRWVEVCYCARPLQEELPYWEEYLDVLQVKDAHDRRHCLDENGEQPWACSGCDCTDKLEARLAGWGCRFIDRLRADQSRASRPLATTSSDSSRAEPERPEAPKPSRPFAE